MSHSDATDKSATPSDQSTEQPANPSPRDVSADLSAFQRDLLYVIYAKREAGQTPHGLSIKDEMEDYYPDEVHHGRLYPNLDTLVDLGIVEKSAIDLRTNTYEVTEFGMAVITARKEWIQSLPNRGGVRMTLRDRVRSLLGFADPDVDARPDTPTTTLSIDDIGAVLENERRREVTRIVVDHYQETEQPVSLGDLADVVAAHENDKPLDLVSSDERKRVYVSLYQIHLPKLEDMGVIVYGDNMDAITPTADANAVCDILETARDIQADPDNVSDAPRSALERDTPTGGDLRYYDSRDLAETATENRGDQA